jgi:hypothetical protein
VVGPTAALLSNNGVTASRVVSRAVPIGGGIRRAMSARVSSEMMPGPLFIAETNPSAEAPHAIAVRASSRDVMQQILSYHEERAGSLTVQSHLNFSVAPSHWKGDRTVPGIISLGADVDCPGFAQPTARLSFAVPSLCKAST